MHDGRVTSIPSDRVDLLTRLAESEARLAATVATLTPEAYAAPSLLPGWTRGHVVGHLTLNAAGLAGAVAAANAGERVAPCMPPRQRRDGDIDVFAGERPRPTHRRRLAAAVADLAAAARRGHARLGRRDASTRTPGSDRSFPAGLVPLMRWREVEIHHADLGAGYSQRGLARGVLRRARRRRWPGAPAPGASRPGRPTSDARGSVVPTDPSCRARVGDLGWWLTGRGTGEGLTSDDGVLPEMEAW